MTKTKDNYLVDCILCNQELAKVREALALAEDTIRIALNTAGYNVAEMNQFERASALLDMTTEYKANCESLAHYEFVFDSLNREITNVRKGNIMKE